MGLSGGCISSAECVSQLVNRSEISEYSYLEFTGPRKLRIKRSRIDSQLLGVVNGTGFNGSLPLPSPGPRDVLIKAFCSLISTGTELKVFKGEFESGIQTDLTIAGMTDELRFPLQYGYCLAGEVIAVGAAFSPSEAKEWLGRRVFSFSPHGSHAVAPVSSVVAIPTASERTSDSTVNFSTQLPNTQIDTQGANISWSTESLDKREDEFRYQDEIRYEDAVFAPSVETAVSLVQDLNPVLGERIAVIGQGLIGQLVTAVLVHMGMTVTAIDVSDDRLHSNSLLQLCGERTVHLWNPRNGQFTPDHKLKNSSIRSIAHLGDFDSSIEVSGNIAGLNTAVEITGNGGKIIIGSWYSPQSSSPPISAESPPPPPPPSSSSSTSTTTTTTTITTTAAMATKSVPANTAHSLHLGLNFHRSHIQMKASQVSTIPAHLTGRWCKPRRFGLTWDLLKKLRPSRAFLEPPTSIEKALPTSIEVLLRSVPAENENSCNTVGVAVTGLAESSVVNFQTASDADIEDTYSRLERGGSAITCLFRY